MGWERENRRPLDGMYFCGAQGGWERVNTADFGIAVEFYVAFQAPIPQ